MAEQKAKTNTDTEPVKTKRTYSKEQLGKSKHFRDRKGILNVLLKSDKKYTFEEAEDMISKFMKGQVK